MPIGADSLLRPSDPAFGVPGGIDPVLLEVRVQVRVRTGDDPIPVARMTDVTYLDLPSMKVATFIAMWSHLMRTAAHEAGVH